VVVTPPGHGFCDFLVEGEIDEDALGKLLTELRAHFVVKAADAGATVGAISEQVRDRPIAVLRAMLALESPDLDALRGFHFSYESDGFGGFVDVFATRTGEGRWRLAGGLHEPRP
jgi:hypothetical protein